MDPNPDDMTRPSRRVALGAPAAVLLSATGACAADDRKAATGRKALVAYFTRSGNTRVIAEQLQRELPADIFEILPATPYPADYEQTVQQARQERDAGVRPPLKATVPNLVAYDALYLGFPIWGETTPPIIRAFLAAHDLTAKRVQPFITHGGFGPGASLDVLKAHAPKAAFAQPFLMEADQERRTMTQVRSWLAARRQEG
jgi:flavodoxin